MKEKAYERKRTKNCAMKRLKKEDKKLRNENLHAQTETS